VATFYLRMKTLLKPVFRIRDILRRIRILGCVLWITDPNLDSDTDPNLDTDLDTDPDLDPATDPESCSFPGDAFKE
jgi:hypothetical protein